MDNIRIEIIGQEALNKALASMPKLADAELKKMLAEGAINTQREALDSIRSHRSNGNSYRRRSVVHTASTPGNPPNTDTGNLVRNITIAQEQGGYTVGSRKGAPYGLWLEFGTSKMEARPWLLPAFKKILKPLVEKYKNKGLKK